MRRADAAGDGGALAVTGVEQRSKVLVAVVTTAPMTTEDGVDLVEQQRRHRLLDRAEDGRRRSGEHVHRRRAEQLEHLESPGLATARLRREQSQAWRALEAVDDMSVRGPQGDCDQSVGRGEAHVGGDEVAHGREQLRAIDVDVGRGGNGRNLHAVRLLGAAMPARKPLAMVRSAST